MRAMVPLVATITASILHAEIPAAALFCYIFSRCLHIFHGGYSPILHVEPI
jgi:hypothetical protein